jgi:hypothetical protein
LSWDKATIYDVYNPKRGPREYVVKAVAKVCAEKLGEDTEGTQDKLIALWRLTPEGQGQRRRGSPPDQVTPKQLPAGLVDVFLEQLWDGREEELADEFVRGEYDLAATATVLVEVVERDPGAVVGLLAALENREEFSIARQLFDFLTCADQSAADAVSTVPTMVPLRATTPEAVQAPPPDAEADLPLSAIDPLLGRGLRWAASLRQRKVDQVRLELLAAAAQWQPFVDPQPAAEQPDIGEATELVKAWRIRGYLHERAGHQSFDPLTALSQLEAVAAAGDDGPDLAAGLLAELLHADYRQESAICLEVLVQPPEGHRWPRLSQHLPAALSTDIMAEMLLELTEDVYQERRKESARNLGDVIGALPAEALIAAMCSSTIAAASASDVAQILNFDPGWLWRGLVTTELPTGPAVLWATFVQWHGTPAFETAAKHLLSLTSPAKADDGRTVEAVSEKQLLRVFKQGLVTQPTEAGELILTCYGLQPAVVSKLIAELVADSVAMVRAVADLALTERGIPVQLLNEMVQMQLGEVQPLLMALVQAYPTQVYRILVDHFESMPDLVERLLMLSAAKDPDGPWTQAAEILLGAGPTAGPDSAEVRTGRVASYLDLLQQHDSDHDLMPGVRR